MNTGPATASRWRWVLLGLSFVIAMVGYADRQFLGLLKPVLDAQFHWSPSDYGAMGTAFQIAIACCLLGAGWFLDRVGLRWGFAIGLGGWSLASGLHAAARTVPQFIAARVALGAFEAVGTPAGMKALAMYFGPQERTLAIGIANTAPNLAAVATPLAVSGIYMMVGWQWTILCLAAAGFICLAAWLALPFARMPVLDTAAGAAAQARDGWRVLHDRQAWILAGTKFLTDQAWWFMLFWLPDFLHARFGLDMRHLGAPVAVIYAMAACGSLAGGIVPSALHRGLAIPPARARMLAMAGFAVCVTPVAVISGMDGLWSTVLVAGLALACHQGFATNIFALAADIFPAARIGTAIGFAAFFGNMAGAGSSFLAGWLLRRHGSLGPMFLLAAGGYGLAWSLLYYNGVFGIPTGRRPGRGLA